MRSAEEHKKFLEQFAALERNSVNYFDVEREFFLIDANNLSNVQSQFYGYSIQADGIYENDNLTPEAVDGLDGRGCYVCIDVRGEQITIKQDLNGSWGIYLFRHGDYFALSNSFFRLLDHVKFRYPLTVNRVYCNHLMGINLTSHAYSETAVNEITLVERHMIIRIDAAKKELQLDPIDYKEKSLALDSPEGIAALDSWVELWGNVIRGVTSHTKFFTADLSGGFDTRTPFMLLLHSGVDCGKITINSFNSTRHTYEEDFAIASKIAEHYALTLNRPLPKSQFLNYSLSDSLNIDLYYRQTFKKRIDCFTRKPVDKQYCLNGYAGETIRGNWLRFNKTPKEFTKARATVKNYSPDLSAELSSSIKKIFESAFRSIRAKYKIADKESMDIVQYLYQEARCRSHFGKTSLGNYLKNLIMLSPALDPIVRTLQVDTSECPDSKLLIALLFTRYEPALLAFPFQGNRSISPEAIANAKKINERFPRHLTTNKIDAKKFSLLPRDARAEKILASGKNNKAISSTTAQNFLKAAFDSSKTYGLFTSHFDAELYTYAADFYDNSKASRDRYFYSICGIAKVLEDVEFSRRNHPLYCDVKRFIEEDFCQIR